MAKQNPILSQIMYQTYTIYHLNHRLRILKEYLENYYYSSDKKETGLSSEDLNWLSSLPKTFYDSFRQDKLSETFKQLNEEVKELNPLVVYIAIEIPQSELINLGFWLRTNLGENFLIDIKLDPTLIGGCAIVWKGVYRDYSLRAKITQQNSEVFASFRSYLK